MAMYTNVSQRLITLPDLEVMIPGVPMDMEDDTASHPGVQDLIEVGDIKAGDPETNGEAEQLPSAQQRDPHQVPVQTASPVAQRSVAPPQGQVRPPGAMQAPVTAPPQQRPSPPPQREA